MTIRLYIYEEYKELAVEKVQLFKDNDGNSILKLFVDDDELNIVNINITVHKSKAECVIKDIESYKDRLVIVDLEELCEMHGCEYEIYRKFEVITSHDNVVELAKMCKLFELTNECYEDNSIEEK